MSSLILALRAVCIDLQYTMLSGQVPFQSSRSFRSSDFIMQRITRGDITFEGPQWESISPAAKELIKGTISWMFSNIYIDRLAYQRRSQISY